MQKHSLLVDLLDIKQQIEADRKIDRDTLKSRDREIGIKVKSTTPGRQLLRNWIAHLRQVTPNEENTETFKGEQSQQVFNAVLGGLWILGLLAGALLTRAALYYDGSQPVNIISALLILVGTQVFTLLLLVLFNIFGMKGVLRSLSIFNPAAFVARLLQRLNPTWRDKVDQLMKVDRNTGRQFAQPMISYLAQHFSVALNLGIVITILYLVTVSDLAFGWNSTLNPANATMHAWFQGMAMPWQLFWLMPILQGN